MSDTEVSDQMAPSSAGQQLPVYCAADFLVTSGANHGDALSHAAELLLDDSYELGADAQSRALSVILTPQGGYQVAPNSALGTPGATLHLDSCITLMPLHGGTIEALILVEVDTSGHIAEIYLYPLAPLAAKTAYTLVGIDCENAKRRMALINCVSFAAGTNITMATGAQHPVETLKVGDRILTRDSGIQKIRWIGRSTLRASGPFAPVTIKAGTLNNLGDLTVHPDHRLFIYQRQDAFGVGQAELLVKARHLVNGDSITTTDGGFVEYVQILFDTHEIIFAEGIATETMAVTHSTRPVLPRELAAKFAQSQPGLPGKDAIALELNEAFLQDIDTAEYLRRASGR
ncbi:Hint domain-containing protein [Cognatishimia sp. SS12]|uniref:Hint domain-containing protein n=1 Tax=Cognatishimia sp. SS12 TaxID=2979465 RepID=UPI00232D1A60|nr:Hint domain-containing protein [Cognatishimia sp. SS12]MDC0737014.1 Hint domain-containing protein [Cognatishimia sp. SS12]